MTAMNIVHCRVKPEREQDFLDWHRNRGANEMTGFQSFSVVKTGDCEYTFVARWDSMDAIVAARPQMIANLDQFRDMLEEFGETGVTEPRSGEVVVEFTD
ncbi:MAG: antibiotic biosynthesis monooxygenase [Paracoccaceae bacterium]|nr:antibiotic biosynthesis monooxygenase [Paracoccaceae bacterium]